MNIRTKWHRLLELVDKGEVTSLAPKDGLAKWHEEAGMDLVKIKEALLAVNDVPKFVVDPALLDLSRKDEFHRSLLDMKRAGVLHLPFPLALIEIPSRSGLITSGHTIVILEDGSRYQALPDGAPGKPAEDTDVGGWSMTVQSDSGGDYVAIAQTWTWVAIEERNGQPEIKFSSQEGDWSDAEKAGHPELIESTHLKNSMSVASAWFVAMLLMSTKGVVQDRIDVPKLNKQRAQQGKHAIPMHTYIRIGHVYQKDGTTREYDERKSPRPHWRRGHIRNVRVGPRSEGKTHPVYVQPMLVAYHPEFGGNAPKTPDYVVKA
jgi:hypothetical protein